MRIEPFSLQRKRSAARKSFGMSTAPATPCTGRRRASVKAAFDRNHLRAAGHLERELQRVLVRFRARVHEENGVEAEAAKRRETSCGAPAHVERHGIALEA